MPGRWPRGRAKWKRFDPLSHSGPGFAMAERPVSPGRTVEGYARFFAAPAKWRVHSWINRFRWCEILQCPWAPGHGNSPPVTRQNRSNGRSDAGTTPKNSEQQWRPAMKTVRTLILAVRILLSLGIGTPMAQSESASMHTDFYGMVNMPTRSHQATTHVSWPARLMWTRPGPDRMSSHLLVSTAPSRTPAEPGDHLEANDQSGTERLTPPQQQ
jgi:hypothetical protein